MSAPNDLNQVIGERVRALRAMHDVTQADLAKSVGMSRTSITAIEAGNQSAPLGTLAAIARRFGCPMSALLGETPLPTLPDVWIVTRSELHCAKCGWLDEGLTPEEAARQRSEHLAIHLTMAAAGAPPDPEQPATEPEPAGANVIPLPAR